jgi:peptidoglycan/xylan/chitin deacetylase (PgdA/CDA1 family)
VVAITIDDGWNASVVRAMLKILARERVNVTFFPAGRAVAAHPAVWREVADAGFPIADHTYLHGHLTKRTTAAIVGDIRYDAALILRASGKPMTPILRPPFGDWGATAYRAAAATGQWAIVTWDVTIGDTGPGDVAHLVANAAKARPGSIVLMHANHWKSVAALEAMIALYRHRGYGFVTVAELLGYSDAMPYPAVTMPWLPPSPYHQRPTSWALFEPV